MGGVFLKEVRKLLGAALLCFVFSCMLADVEFRITNSRSEGGYLDEKYAPNQFRYLPETEPPIKKIEFGVSGGLAETSI